MYHDKALKAKAFFWVPKHNQVSDREELSLRFCRLYMQNNVTF